MWSSRIGITSGKAGQMAHSEFFEPRRREGHEVGPASSKVKPPSVMAVHRRGVTLLLAGPLFAFFASSRLKRTEMRLSDRALRLVLL
jgi:hypothetical protein